MGKRNKKRKHIDSSLNSEDHDKSHGLENHSLPKKSKIDDVATTLKHDYPTLVYPELHKLQSSITIHDLQNLVLQCLADGITPRWVTVKNAQKVRKAVVLLVPGLEQGMFDGTIEFNQSEKEEERVEQLENHGDVDSCGIEATSKLPIANAVSNPKVEIKMVPVSPDDFMPVRMDDDKLPPPLKPLASMFTYQWPVKASADGRYFKIHSPVHTLLTAPLTKSEESKKKKMELTKATSASGRSLNPSKRTPITEFITSAEELIDNDYILHPLHLSTPIMREQQASRKNHVVESSDGGIEAEWKDSPVMSFEEGEVPKIEIEAGSITAGRNVLAIDCEMCRVVNDQLALTRLSVVDWDGNIVMDELAKPYKPITDYLTP